MSYWELNNDLLERQIESQYLIQFLEHRVADKVRRGLCGSYVLNIDASWGEGKTFFVKGLFADLAEAGHPAIMIDAWRDDFTDDPLTAVVAEFDQFLTQFKSRNATITKKVKAAGKNLRRNIGKLSLLIGKGVGKRVVQYGLGESADEVVAALKDIVPATSNVDAIVGDARAELVKLTNAAIDKYAAKKLEQFNEAKVSLSNFQQSLKGAVEALTAGNLKPPFFILVDELDRCRPTYAIEMLERIKHLFEVENVVFVLSTDTKQLANSIKAVYGNDFDSRHYLARFFDRSYMLAAPNRTNMVSWALENSLMDKTKIATNIDLGFVELIAAVSDQFLLEIRQIEKAIDLLATISTVWDEVVPIELTLMFPIIVAFLKGNNLESESKLKEVFKINISPNNYANRQIGNCNVGGLADLMFSYNRKTLYEISREIENVTRSSGRQNLGEPTRLAYEIILNEYQRRKSNTAKPLFRTYAQRVRMAGRFIEPQ